MLSLLVFRFCGIPLPEIKGLNLIVPVEDAIEDEESDGYPAQTYTPGETPAVTPPAGNTPEVLAPEDNTQTAAPPTGSVPAVTPPAGNSPAASNETIPADQTEDTTLPRQDYTGSLEGEPDTDF